MVKGPLNFDLLFYFIPSSVRRRIMQYPANLVISCHGLSYDVVFCTFLSTYGHLLCVWNTGHLKEN